MDHKFNITVDLDTLVEVDIDGLNDIACEAFGSVELQGMTYKVVGLEGEGIVVEVEGYTEDEN